MNVLTALGERQLHTTLAAAVYVDGYCVLATAMAPVRGNETLIAGSGNAGDFIRDEIPVFSRLLRRAASSLGLRLHTVKDRFETKYELATPYDCELHCGTDGRFVVAFSCSIVRQSQSRVCTVRTVKVVHSGSGASDAADTTARQHA
jgi:hypothetical protein